MKPGAEPDVLEPSPTTNAPGAYPLTAAVESDATTLPEIVGEMFVARTSERQGRLIDHDEVGSMELKKREGYF